MFQDVPRTVAFVCPSNQHLESPWAARFSPDRLFRKLVPDARLGFVLPALRGLPQLPSIPQQTLRQYWIVLATAGVDSRRLDTYAFGQSSCSSRSSSACGKRTSLAEGASSTPPPPQWVTNFGAIGTALEGIKSNMSYSSSSTHPTAQSFQVLLENELLQKKLFPYTSTSTLDPKDAIADQTMCRAKRMSASSI